MRELKHCPLLKELKVCQFTVRLFIVFLALICFSENSHECEIFDGRTSRRTLNSTFTHDLGGLGYYKGQPTSVGCQSTNNKKAETLTASGWTALHDFSE